MHNEMGVQRLMSALDAKWGELENAPAARQPPRLKPNATPQQLAAAIRNLRIRAMVIRKIHAI